MRQMDVGSGVFDRAIEAPSLVKHCRYQSIIDRICSMRWSSLTEHEILRVAKAYYYFSVQFRENLSIACRLHPDNADLQKLLTEECNTDNLSPWDGVAEAGEKLDHDEFVRRALSLAPLEGVEPLALAGEAYLATVRAESDLTRAKAIASYEGGGLSSVFTAILRAPGWQSPGARAFRHFLICHIEFDDGEDGHGSLASDLDPDDSILPLWTAFEEILREAVPRIAPVRPQLACEAP